MPLFLVVISKSSGLCKSMDKYVKFSRTPQLYGNALGDLVESCFGAIILDTGFNLDHVWKIMLSFLDHVINFSKLQLNPVRELQELCQSHNMELEFGSSEKDNTYIVAGKLNGKNVSEYSSVGNLSKKAAKRIAAEQVILMLKVHKVYFTLKSLEEVLMLTNKMETILIGYNETPTRVSSSKMHPLGGEPHRSGASKIELNRELSSPPDPLECHTTGGSFKKSAKSSLYEICAANCWDPPVFLCCKEDGESHLREVIVNPHCLRKMFTKKKVAPGHAAERAVWLLKNDLSEVKRL